MIQLVRTPKDALRVSHDLSFEMVWSDAYEDIPVKAWEATINKKCAPTTARVVTPVHEEGRVEFGNRHVENHRTENEDVIAGEVKYAVRSWSQTNC